MNHNLCISISIRKSTNLTIIYDPNIPKYIIFILVIINSQTTYEGKHAFKTASTYRTRKYADSANACPTDTTNTYPTTTANTCLTDTTNTCLTDTTNTCLTATANTTAGSTDAYPPTTCSADAVHVSYTISNTNELRINGP